MTATQLMRLAELAATAADFFAVSDPDTARLFADTALHADGLSTELRRAETRARLSADLSVVEPERSSGVAP